MGPSKRSRSLSKRLSHIDEVYSDKGLEHSRKHQQRKKRFYGKLGPRWNEQEIELFYVAYRKHGYDWKKVAAAVRTRSREMVEALYQMNRAYLSLPDGTATVRGLIAMMIDHYHAQMEGSESERESNDVPSMYNKPSKRGNLNVNSSRDLLQSQCVSSSDACLSFLKGKQPIGRAVGKRTPRFPVSYSNKKDLRKLASPNLNPRVPGHSGNDDDEHVAALALTEASHRGGSPQHSRTPSGRGTLKPLVYREEDKTELGEGRLYGAASSCGGEESKNIHYEYRINSFVDMEVVGTGEINRKGKESYQTREKPEEHADMVDCREACSGTGEDIHMNSKNETSDIEVTNKKMKQISPPARVRNKKQLLDNQGADFYALQTLADLSLAASTIESEPPLHVVNKVKGPDGEATSPSHLHDRSKYASGRTILSDYDAKMPVTIRRMHSRELEKEIKDISDSKLQAPSSKPLKRKRKPSSSKAAAELDSHENGSFETKKAEENRASSKAKRSCPISPSARDLKPLKSDRSIGIPFLNCEQREREFDQALAFAQGSETGQIFLPNKTRSRRKLDRRGLLKTSGDLSEKSSKDLPSKFSSSMQEKEKLSAGLSSSLVRKWCVYEWFYSATDYPWFARNEFVEYLHHAGLGHIPRLTRVEWGVIRSSLGKPRRFSDRFLIEEKCKLNLYREAVRKHYNELRAGISDGLPTDLARPLSVGQRVVAIHPKTREVHDGSVLTVDHDRCRIQFDRPELGVGFVMDVECMPLNPLENMPESVRRRNACVAKFSPFPKVSIINGRLNESMMFTPFDHRVKHCKYSSNPSIMTERKGPLDNAISPDAVCNADSRYTSLINLGLSQDRATKSDVESLCELNRALEKKESLLMELRHANNDVIESQINGDILLKDSTSFKRHYATILVELKEASDEVSTAVLQLRDHNTYPWQKQPALANCHCGHILDTFGLDSQEATSNVLDIIKESRLKAYTMVDAALQAMAGVDEGEDAFVRINEALIAPRKPEVPELRYPEANGGLINQNQLRSCISESELASCVGSPRISQDSCKEDAPIPLDLIASCVSTLIMIQTCSERHYPPADVAQIIDTAVTSLQPCCPQNLPLFREIQMCMGRIKTQILALVPT